jgi:uncharacterized protein involved in type VI secretion and phage assembly
MSAVRGVEPVAPPGERFYGKYRGVVVDLDDPNGQGRVRARVPEVLGEVESGWALPAAPYAGPGVGLFAVPPVDAAVWIEFEAGLVERPIWSGCIWGAEDAPERNNGAKATPEQKILRSERGLIVALDDRTGAIDVSDADGSNLLRIETQGGRVTIKSASKAIVEAPQVELVEDGTHQAVLGDELLRYLGQLITILQTHVHPSSGAPPAAPLPPPPPSLLSQRVRLG